MLSPLHQIWFQTSVLKLADHLSLQLEDNHASDKISGSSPTEQQSTRRFHKYTKFSPPQQQTYVLIVGPALYIKSSCIEGKDPVLARYTVLLQYYKEEKDVHIVFRIGMMSLVTTDGVIHWSRDGLGIL
jgi:hypothetical protein